MSQRRVENIQCEEFSSADIKNLSAEKIEFNDDDFLERESRTLTPQFTSNAFSKLLKK